MTVDKRYELWFDILVYAWTITLVLGVARCVPRAELVIGVTACVDAGPCSVMPRYESCAFYMDLMRSDRRLDSEPPSIEPAEFGIRIIVDRDFNPLMGSSYQVPGGSLVWNVWKFRWYDGDHMGAIGRVGDSLQCQWFDPK
jgi:hypothetical protein